MSLALGLALPAARRPGLDAISRLAKAGEVSSWMRMSDWRTTTFSDAAGTTPLTALESAMGLVLDRSKGLVRGVDLHTSHTANTSASESAGPDGFTKLTANGSSDPFISFQSNSAVAGKTYEITVEAYTDAAEISAGVRLGLFGYTSTITEVQNRIADLSAQPQTFRFMVRFSASAAGNGVFRVDIEPNATAAGRYLYYRNWSVREIPGHHATQSTAAARMVLSARVNQFVGSATPATQTYTSRTAATHALSFTGSGSVALSGATTGSLAGVDADTRVAASFALAGVKPTPVIASVTTAATGGTLAASTTYSYRLVARDGSGVTLASSAATVTTGTGSTNTATVNWTRVDGATGYDIYGRAGGSEAKIASVGDVATWTDDGSIAPSGAVPSSNTTGRTTFTVSGDVRDAQLELGTTATRYQRVTSSTDYDQAGFPVYAKSDLVDDAAVITFPADQGAANTIVRTAPGGVIEWLENQTIGTSYSVTKSFNDLVIFPRLLTTAEKNAVQAQLASPLGIATTPFKEPVAPANVAAPTITGDNVVGAVATLSDGTWIGEPTPTLTRQVQRYSAGAWGDIAGATGTSYTYEFDGSHRLKVTGDNGVGPAVVAYSAEVVVGTTANPPTLVSAPIMSGNAYTGSTVYTLPGNWDGAGTLTYAYQPQYRATSTDAWADFGTAVANFIPDAVGEYSCLVTATGDGGVSDPRRSNTMKVSQAPVVDSAIDKTFTGAGVDTEVTTFDTSLAYFANPNVTESLIVKAATNSVHANNNSGSMQGVYPTARSLGDRQSSKVTIYQTDANSQVVAFVRGVNYDNILWVQAGAGGASLIQKVGGVATDYPLGTAFADGDIAELEISADGTTASVRRNGAHTAGGTWPSPITLTTVQPAGGVAGAGLWSSTTTEAGSFTRFIVDDFTAAPAAPSLDYAPRVIGDLAVNATLQTTYGVWFGAPEPTYAILWQQWDGSAWVAAGGTNNAVSYTPTIAGDYRSRVTASNSEGTTVSFSPSVTVAGTSTGGNYVSGRVIIDDTNGAPEPIIARIEFLSGGTPLTGTASASSEAGAQYAAANAFDTDAATVWSSMLGIDESPYIDLTFTAASTFTQVAITAANLEGQDGSAAPRAIRIQGSDGTTRTTLLTIENTTGWAPGERRVFNL